MTFIDDERGILQHRGYPIEELAEHSTFVGTAWLLMYGELPSEPQLARFRELLSEQQLLHEGMRNHFEGFPPNGHPMAMINACGCYHRERDPKRRIACSRQVYAGPARRKYLPIEIRLS
jgi:citrate synthase